MPLKRIENVTQDFIDKMESLKKPSGELYSPGYVGSYLKRAIYWRFRPLYPEVSEVIRMTSILCKTLIVIFRYPTLLQGTGKERSRTMDMFHKHLTEMILSMVVPFSIFFVVMRVTLPSVGFSPPFFLMFPSALFVMIVPMTAWMLYRHHPLRDIVEMNASMFAGMLVVLPIARFAFPSTFTDSGSGVIFPLILIAMTAPMVILMHVKREHYTHHGHSSVSSPRVSLVCFKTRGRIIALFA